MNGEQIVMIPGTNRDLSLSQFFTPPDLAQRVVEWAFEGRTSTRDPLVSQARVLEPSAGNGALVRPLVAAGAEVTAIELDDRYAFELDLGKRELCWICPCDFLEVTPPTKTKYDLCVMNPPYESGLDVAFVLHALKFAPRVVGIFRSALLHGATRKRELWSHVRPARIAFLSERPRFGEGNGARSDFIVVELVSLRYPELHAGGPHPTTVEFW